MKSKKKVPRTYPLERSPFYRLGQIRKLAVLLKCKPRDLRWLEKNPQYNIFQLDDREIQEPMLLHRRVHDRIQTLLSRIETPSFLFSGKRGLSNIDNARVHRWNRNAVMMDIKQFYRNSTKEKVFQLFRYGFEMPDDIAHLVANICCYKNMIPTGSPVSQTLAFLAYRRMFEQIETITRTDDATLSVYVDDITISRKRRFGHDYHLRIDSVLKRNGLWIKRKKLQYRSSRQDKLITGCVITPNHEARVANRHRLGIIRDLSDLSAGGEEKSKIYRRVMGRVANAQQIEREVFAVTRRQLQRKAAEYDLLVEETR